MAENFDLIFGSSASQSYSWNDSDYQNGWQTVGDTPPTREQFDALQRRNDKKAQELKNALTPLVDANTADSRQPATSYDVNTIKYIPSLPTGWYLECTTAGISGTGDITLPTTIAENATVTDGTVVWTIRKIGSGGDGVPLGAIIAYSANGELPSGYLLCDGSAVSRTMFPDLFAAIGTTYGAGDGSTTFNLPDYNAAERFCQGSTVAGTVKQAGLPNITGNTTGVGYATAITVDGSFSPEQQNIMNWGAGANGSCLQISFDASRSSAIYGNSTTVQPPALTMRYIIKAFNGMTHESALIDITQYAQELAGKADRRLSNLDTANLACHVVVDSYYDDTTGDWWREYDDGWVEQGGIDTAQTYNEKKTCNLLRPMDSNNYTLVGVANDSDGNNATAETTFQLVSSKKTATSFVWTYTNRSTPSYVMPSILNWMACGMGASA